MQKIEFKNGMKIIHNLPDYTPEERLKEKEIILDKLYSIFFHDDK